VQSPDIAAGRIPAPKVRALYTDGVTTTEPTTVYLALGSNLGDRAGAIARALALLEAHGVGILARSAIYETDPVAPDPQPLYLNAVVRGETALSAEALLALGLEVERALGRRRPPDRAPAPREIDIDLLLYGEAIICTPPALVVPHPRLLERPFVRIPLADVAASGLRHPVTGEPLDRAAADPSVRRR
jgi:2-amino-4-hydroxy-6-hydroxymethyldihydropteridine diphosphokinase